VFAVLIKGLFLGLSALATRIECRFSTLWDPMDVFRSLIESWF
jgi:hypothetical protein